MSQLMRCLYCGLLQDEPVGTKECARCGGELAYEAPPPPDPSGSYLKVQMELDQVRAPAGQALDRYLLVTLRTPVEVPPQQAAPTESGRPPLNLAAVLDVSGSMRGEKMEQTKEAVRRALRFLRDGDLISLATFSDEPHRVLDPAPVSAKTQEILDHKLNHVRAGGMTALCGGLELGIEQADENRLDNTLVLLLSDGQANVGETDIERVGVRASEARKRGMVVSTLGVGADYNEALMTEIAVQGGGRYYHIQDASQIVPTLTGELGEAADLAARDIRIQIRLPQGAVLVPLSAAYKVEMEDGLATVSIGDMPVDLEAEIPLRLTLFGGKAGERLSLDGEVTYNSPAGNQLAAVLNRVTVRFVEQTSFQLREGVVLPVAERVAKQMRATQVLRYSRAVTRGVEDEVQQADREQQKLREYMHLLGEEEAQKMVGEMEQDLYAVRAASPAAKQVMADAFRVQRAMRKQDK